jgi:hypothetical protein
VSRHSEVLVGQRPSLASSSRPPACSDNFSIQFLVKIESLCHLFLMAHPIEERKQTDDGRPRPGFLFISRANRVINRAERAKRKNVNGLGVGATP